MAEYINREELKRRFQKRLDWLEEDVYDEYSGALLDGCKSDMELIDEIPAADVAPVVHGRWLRNENNYYDDYYCTYFDYNCSVCDGVVNDRHGLPDYCPHCGAKMEGWKDNG